MNDFEGKRLKLYLNTDSGWSTATGKFIKQENGFLAIYNELLEKIQYFSMYHIRNIEILRDDEEE